MRHRRWLRLDTRHAPSRPRKSKAAGSHDRQGTRTASAAGQDSKSRRSGGSVPWTGRQSGWKLHVCLKFPIFLFSTVDDAEALLQILGAILLLVMAEQTDLMQPI